MPNRLLAAKQHLDEAIKDLDVAHSTWSECVTTLHMAELNLRRAQRQMQECYNVVADILK